MSGMSEAAKRGRRNWSLEDKWRIVEEAQLPGNSVAEVARRRGVNSNLLFRWIRAAEAGQLGHRPDSLVLLPQPALDFVPIGVFGRGDDGGPAMTIPVAPPCGGSPGGEFAAAQIGVAGQRADIGRAPRRHRNQSCQWCSRSR
ncbi:transposase [Sinorhizobium meliloti]|uniref:transposase n=1 Tax=Rhizobium meliloti TaxID=382 RepID=UPI003D64CC0A